jgi:hypothetical protein
VLEAAYALTNPQNLGSGAYWDCAGDPDIQFALQLSPGTGSYKDVLHGGALEAFTWQAESSDSILITSNTPAGVPFAEMLDILTSPPTYPTEATFTLVMSGNPAISCNIEIGAIADATCIAMYPECACAGWVSSDGRCVQTTGTGTGSCPSGCVPGNGTCVPGPDAGTGTNCE